MNDAQPIPTPAEVAPPPTTPPVVVRRVFSTRAVIAFTCIGVLFFLAAFGAAIFLATRRLSPADPNAALTQQYTPQTGLFTAHYPADFAARMESGGVFISRRNYGVDEEAVVVAAVAHPITDDARELARVMEVAFRKAVEAKGFRVMGGDLQPAKCPTSGAVYDGIEIIDVYWMIESAPITTRSCTFLAHGHGYKMAYLVPRALITEERPLLERIVEATELTK